MFKVSMMSIIKFISSIFGLSLGYLAIYSMAKSQASLIPGYICIFMLCIDDTIISHILIKKGKENSPYFDPEHHWKYSHLIGIIDFLIVIIMYRYLL